MLNETFTGVHNFDLHQGSGLVHGESGRHGLQHAIRTHREKGRLRARPGQLLQRGLLQVPQEGVLQHRTPRRVHALEADHFLFEGPHRSQEGRPHFGRLRHEAQRQQRARPRHPDQSPLQKRRVSTGTREQLLLT